MTTTRKRRSTATRSDAFLTTNVKATLATAVQVLEHLQQSLLRSGFVEGAESYGKLADTLIGQKLWSASQAVDTDAEFAAIASLARSIHDILAPYNRTMLRLSGLGPTQDRPIQEHVPQGPMPASAATPSAQPANGVRAELLNLLSAARRPLSSTALRAHCRCDRRLLAAELEALEQAGRVKRHERSGRTLYSLGSQREG